MPVNRLAIGTVQFGLPYGIANQSGQISLHEAKSILSEACAQGIDTLDTAIAYGTSEQQLGTIGVQGWKIITKLPGLSTHISDTAPWMRNLATESLKKLGVDRLQGLLLHRPADFFSPQGQDLYQGLQQIKADGRVDKIGVSIYDPHELTDLLPHFDIDLVQAPLNILDRRLIDTGWLESLHARGIAVHVRSVFLQGLLLMPAAERPGKFIRWQPLWQRWDDWIRDTGQTPLQACLGFALAQPWVERVIVGVDGLTQFQEILTAAAKPSVLPPADLKSVDLDLINPSRWQYLP